MVLPVARSRCRKLRQFDSRSLDTPRPRRWAQHLPLQPLVCAP